MVVKEFIAKIDSGDAKVLTVEAAKALKGKHIAWMYFGYKGNYLSVQEMTVGKIVSELDYMETQPCEGFKSRADYWRSYMSKKQLDEVRKTLSLLNMIGNPSLIYAHPESSLLYGVPTFTCSDVDREVYYIEL